MGTVGIVVTGGGVGFGVGGLVVGGGVGLGFGAGTITGGRFLLFFLRFVGFLGSGSGFTSGLGILPFLLGIFVTQGLGV